MKISKIDKTELLDVTDLIENEIGITFIPSDEVEKLYVILGNDNYTFTQADIALVHDDFSIAVSDYGLKECKIYIYDNKIAPAPSPAIDLFTYRLDVTDIDFDDTSAIGKRIVEYLHTIDEIDIKENIIIIQIGSRKEPYPKLKTDEIVKTLLSYKGIADKNIKGLCTNNCFTMHAETR